MKDKFWTLKQVHIPDRNNAIWLVQCGWVLVV